MMDAVFEIYDENERLILDLSDNVAGNVVQFSTGKSNGSRTIPTDAGEYVEFAFTYPSGLTSAGQPSPFPSYYIAGNTIQWTFSSSGSSSNLSQDIIGFVY